MTIDAASAIRRPSFAESQHSSAEAMVAMARHRSELARETQIEQRTEAQTADDLADRVRDEYRVDRTA